MKFAPGRDRRTGAFRDQYKWNIRSIIRHFSAEVAPGRATWKTDIYVSHSSWRGKAASRVKASSQSKSSGVSTIMKRRLSRI